MLPSLDWTPIVSSPPALPPASIADAFVEAGVTPLKYLEIEAVLLAERSSFTEVITPRLFSFSATHTCPPLLQ